MASSFFTEHAARTNAARTARATTDAYLAQKTASPSFTNSPLVRDERHSLGNAHAWLAAELRDRSLQRDDRILTTKQRTTNHARAAAAATIHGLREHSAFGSILTTSQPDKFFRSALKASDPSSPRFSVGAALSNYAEEQEEEDERVATVMRELESQAKVRAVDRERQRAKAAVLAVQGAGSPPREAVMRLRNLGSALARDSAIYKMPS